MSGWKKLASAAAATGGGLNVEDVFSTYLYTGTGANGNTISNGIDLSTEGGMVWIKARSAARDHKIQDTERGATKVIVSNKTDAEITDVDAIVSFNTNGFTVDDDPDCNLSGANIASWTFRKAPKFFDVVTYTGDGNPSQSISHNLGTTVGTLIVKQLNNGTIGWRIWHRTFANTQGLAFTTAVKYTSSTSWGSTTPTATEFTVGSYLNTSGETYVAYLFAHNDGDGDFGPTGDQDIIKCGSYIGNANSSSTGNTIDLGFEPQFIIVKPVSNTGNWHMYDAMRGMFVSYAGNEAKEVHANSNSTENTYVNIYPTSNGFRVHSSQSEWNALNATYIYIAIRRGPMAVPTSGTDVFAVDIADNSAPTNGYEYDSGFPVDMGLRGYRHYLGSIYYPALSSRLTQGQFLVTSSAGAEQSVSANAFDFMDGFYSGGQTDAVAWMWRRAPNFFDVVAYRGNGTSGHTINHNLNVAPEMMWIKNREATNSVNWTVYHKDVTGYAHLNSSASWVSTALFDNIGATSFDLLYSSSLTNTNQNYIAYLFASLDGISKVGSYTGNGSTQTINCGFSSGARFILIKRTDSTGDWYVWDAERGIVAANDPRSSLNSTSGEVTTDDSVDPVSLGFAVNQVAATNINVSGASYIYYAIA